MTSSIYLHPVILYTFVCFSSRSAPQRAHSTNGQLSGLPETCPRPLERGGPGPAEATAHLWQPLQTGQEGTMMTVYADYFWVAQ